MRRRAAGGSLAVNLAIFAVLVAAWEATVRLLGVSNLLVPPPSEIADALWAGLAADPAGRLALYVPTLETLSEALSGLVIGFAVGLGLAVLMNAVRIIERYAVPYIIGFQALPKIALAPLLVVWFGFGSTSTVVLVATSCFFPILLNALEGFKATDPDRIDLLRSIGAGRTEIFREVIIPSALPFIFSGLQIGLVIAILSAIVGEFVSGRNGLGARIILANNVLDIAEVFAVLILLAVIGAALDWLLRIVRRRLLFWSPGERRLGI
jgi:NitT/TauT family transport system permease protein